MITDEIKIMHQLFGWRTILIARITGKYRSYTDIRKIEIHRLNTQSAYYYLIDWQITIL